jgi:hypothetical protein
MKIIFDSGNLTMNMNKDMNNSAKQKRIERKKKLKRVFNFDAEMKFLDSFWDMKKNKISIEAFNELVKKTLVETEQVSDVVLEYYIEQLKTKELIKKKVIEKDNYQKIVDIANSDEFKLRFQELLNHDRLMFDEPFGWREKSIKMSPLISEFEKLWPQLEEKYRFELTAYAYSPIPKAEKIAENFKRLIKLIE